MMSLSEFNKLKSISSVIYNDSEEILKNSTKTELFMKKRKQIKIPKASKRPKIETEIIEPLPADLVYSSQNVENALNLNTEIPSKNNTIIKVPDLAKLPQKDSFLADTTKGCNGHFFIHYTDLLRSSNRSLCHESHMRAPACSFISPYHIQKTENTTIQVLHNIM